MEERSYEVSALVSTKTYLTESKRENELIQTNNLPIANGEPVQPITPVLAEQEEREKYENSSP